MARSPILFGVLLYTAGTLSMKTLDHVTVREGGAITIPCLYDNQYKPNLKYWCNGPVWHSCTIIARANDTKKWTITDYPAHNIFTVKHNKLMSSDSGFYWCAVEINAKPDDRKYLYVTVNKAPDVFVVNSSVSGQEGGDISVQCFFSSGYKNKLKWCRIKDQSCYTVGRTDTSQNSSVQISDDDGRRSFTVLITGLRLNDSGWYFCSAGDLQVPVQLYVQRDNKNKTESYDAALSPSMCGKQTARNDTQDSDCSSNNLSEQMDWTFLLLYTAVPLLLLLMLVLVIWRLIQKHNEALSKQGPDVSSVADSLMTVTYDTVVFTKAQDHEQNQVCISRPPERDEVIYSTPKLQ